MSMCVCKQAGETPLHVAVRYCHVAIVKQLLEFCTEHTSRAQAVALVNLPNVVRTRRLSSTRQGSTIMYVLTK